MNRRDALGRLLLLLALPADAASPAAKRPRIGYLLQGPVTDPPSRERQAFIDGLREFGLIPGRTVDIVYRSAEGEPEFLDGVAHDLVTLAPDVIVTSGANATLAAKRATRAIPIVMLAVGDPVGIGAIAALARPGGNVTGISFISRDLAPKRVQLMRELMPRAQRLSILWDRRNPNAKSEAEATGAAARRLGLTPTSLALGSDAELSHALDALDRNRPELLYVAFEGGLVASNRTTLARFGVQRGIPLVSGWSFLTEAGGLLSYAPDIPDMFRRAARFVQRILQAERPADLPVELPTRIELAVNLATARAIGITVPRSILLLADRVIE